MWQLLRDSINKSSVNPRLTEDRRQLCQQTAATRGQPGRPRAGTRQRRNWPLSHGAILSWVKRQAKPRVVKQFPQGPEASGHWRQFPGLSVAGAHPDPAGADGPICYVPPTVSEGLRTISGLQLDDFLDHSLGCWPLTHRALPGNSQFPFHLTPSPFPSVKQTQGRFRVRTGGFTGLTDLEPQKPSTSGPPVLEKTPSRQDRVGGGSRPEKQSHEHPPHRAAARTKGDSAGSLPSCLQLPSFGVQDMAANAVSPACGHQGPPTDPASLPQRGRLN